MSSSPTKAPPQMKRMSVVSTYSPAASLTCAPSMILSSECCTDSPELPWPCPVGDLSLSISSMNTMPRAALATSPPDFSTSRVSIASISSFTKRVLASEVASAVTKGTSSRCESVSHMSVLPVPDEPMSSTLLLIRPASSVRGRPILR